MLLSSWQSHCESSPGSFDEYRLRAGWPPTLRPSQPTWTASPSFNTMFEVSIDLFAKKQLDSFSLFDRTPTCDRQTDRHDAIAYTPR